MVSLSKSDQVVIRLEKDAPHLVSLAKSVGLSLKKLNLDGITARVVLVLDASGSMQHQYASGNVQAVLDRVATLALNFDDNGELEVWAFGSNHRKLPNVTLDNLAGYIQRVQRGEDEAPAPATPPPPPTTVAAPVSRPRPWWWWLWPFGWDSTPTAPASKAVTTPAPARRNTGDGLIPGLGFNNEEPALMRSLLADLDFNSPHPTLVVFITDGGIFKSAEISQILVEASKNPVFWQYVGLGGSNYGILENFDTLSGRHVDNAGFFALDDFRKVKDSELFDRLLNEFPSWLQTVQVRTMLRRS
jgi:hypothetical protein